MALQVVEFFGFEPLHPAAQPFIEAKQCPFTGSKCIKPDHGACSLRQTAAQTIICCPNRLYANHHKVLKEVAHEVFGSSTELITSIEAKQRREAGLLRGNEAVMFGKGWGGELPLARPNRSDGTKTGKYYMDWIIAKVNADGELAEFTALEVQTIDTTGSYKDQSNAFFQGRPFLKNNARAYSNGGMNWENVSKRILPQIIYKGHVLRREGKCSKGLFFICPDAVFSRIMDRLGNNLYEYNIGNGTITFRSYNLGPLDDVTGKRELIFGRQFTTTVDQVATAFTSPVNLPPQNTYESAIRKALD